MPALYTFPGEEGSIKVVTSYTERNVYAGLLVLAGFSILALEIVGVRILAPYVGTSVPVWAALMGVTLLGSAIGYYLGGVQADRSFSKQRVVGIAFVAGVTVGVIPFLRPALGAITSNLSPGAAALGGSLALFFVPAVSLGMIITYIIRHFVSSKDRIAQIHGDYYALATLGSIMGVFGTAYLLIPFFTLPQILYGLSAALILGGALLLTARSAEVAK